MVCKTYGTYIVYHYGHRNIFGVLVVLELKVKNSTILTFKVIFLYQKLAESFLFFTEEYYKKGDKLYHYHILINLILNVLCY